jgi:hypothetical protein
MAGPPGKDVRENGRNDKLFRFVCSMAQNDKAISICKAGQNARSSARSNDRGCFPKRRGKDMLVPCVSRVPQMPSNSSLVISDIHIQTET